MAKSSVTPSGVVPNVLNTSTNVSPSSQLARELSLHDHVFGLARTNAVPADRSHVHAEIQINMLLSEIDMASLRDVARIHCFTDLLSALGIKSLRALEIKWPESDTWSDSSKANKYASYFRKRMDSLIKGEQSKVIDAEEFDSDDIAQKIDTKELALELKSLLNMLKGFGMFEQPAFLLADKGVIIDTDLFAVWPNKTAFFKQLQNFIGNLKEAGLVATPYSRVNHILTGFFFEKFSHSDLRDTFLSVIDEAPISKYPDLWQAAIQQTWVDRFNPIRMRHEPAKQVASRLLWLAYHLADYPDAQSFIASFKNVQVVTSKNSNETKPALSREQQQLIDDLLNKSRHAV